MSEVSTETRSIPEIGDAVKVTDERGVQHDGLITAYWSTTTPNGAANVVFVSSDESKHDPYGRQVEHLSSVSHRSLSGVTPGRFWE